MKQNPTPPPYSGIVFDCDSTLATIEGIEELAAGSQKEVRNRIADLTNQAMDGLLPLEKAYGARLSELQPTRDDVDRIGELYVQNALPNAAALVAALHALGKAVFVVSGGLLAPVQHLAEHLGIARNRVQAVDVYFDGDGRYAGFDSDSPLARAGGKLEVLTKLGQEHKSLVLVGDGATDLEAAPACARFIAFAGVMARQSVIDAADACCAHADLAALLPLLCSESELDRLATDPQHTNLVTASKSYV